jgi:hypothetical protein
MQVDAESRQLAGRILQSLRKKKSGGKAGGRPRVIGHEDAASCRCVDCRRAKGWSPFGKGTAQAAPSQRPDVQPPATRKGHISPALTEVDRTSYDPHGFD